MARVIAGTEQPTEAPPSRIGRGKSVRQSWREELSGPPGAPSVLIAGNNGPYLADLRLLLENEGYRVLTAHLNVDTYSTLRQSDPDLIVLETSRSGPAASDLCRGLKANRHTALTPVLMLTADQSSRLEIDGLEAGADSVLGWPFEPALLCTRVNSMLRRQAAVDYLEDSEQMLALLAQAVEQRDNFTGAHCNRMSSLCVAMGMAMGLATEHLISLHRGGYLHDIGKISIPDSILFKQGPLDEAEWRIMKTHPAKGEEICRPIKCLSPVLPIIRGHHERWDGSGYPDGLKGHEIPLLARVLQLADIYDALTSSRPYKQAKTSAEALRIMQEETDRGWRDPELMSLFLLLRHEEVQDAAQIHCEGWQEADVMIQSMRNLQLSILRY